jgi:hypothetical protein
MTVAMRIVYIFPKFNDLEEKTPITIHKGL